MLYLVFLLDTIVTIDCRWRASRFCFVPPFYFLDAEGANNNRRVIAAMKTATTSRIMDVVPVGARPSVHWGEKSGKRKEWEVLHIAEDDEKKPRR